MNRPLLTGALVGGLLSAALLAVLYLARQLVGFPFVPFDVFDWVGRVLPGDVVTFGIDAIVSVIRWLGADDLSAAAKAAEQGLGVAGLLVTGTGVSAALFAILHRRQVRAGILPGLLTGALIAAPVTAISVTRDAMTAGPVWSALFIVAAFLAWGAAVGWTYERLAGGLAEPAGEGATEPGARVEGVDRRRFLVRLGGATAVITVAGAGVGAALATRRSRGRERARGEPWSARNPLPNEGAEVPPVRGTRKELTPVEDHYRIDINTRLPVVDEGDWRLHVHGLVAEPARLTLAALREGYQPLDQFLTLACISNPLAGDLIGTTRWTGVRLRDLLDELGLEPSARYLRIGSADGFHETLSLDLVRDEPRIMLAYAWDGLPLPTEHGFPLRIYIPDHYGMKQPKWIESLEAVAEYQPGYWVERGWDQEARMKATSVIDVVASNMMITAAEAAGRARDTTRVGVEADSQIVPIGGIAHAGARGVSRVEVRVDDGPWRPARLREPLSDLTWVIWRFEWPFEAGEHTLAVRCFDGDGTPQAMERTPVRPDGATGLHDRTVML